MPMPQTPLFIWALINVQNNSVFDILIVLFIFSSIHLLNRGISYLMHLNLRSLNS